MVYPEAGFDAHRLPPGSRRLRDAWERLSALQRDVLSAALSGDDEGDDDAIARRHGTTAEAVRVERILARRRLNDALLGPSS